MSRGWMVLALALGGPVAVAAQSTTTGSSTAPTTRAGILVDQRTAREATLHAERPARLERLLLYVENNRVLERLNPPEGLYPVVGNLVRGSGPAFGAGYRRRPRAMLLDASASATYKGYRTAQFVAGIPATGRRAVELMAGTRWYDYPQEDFFGLGPSTSRVDRVSFTLQGLDTYAQVMGRHARWLVARGRVGVHRYRVGPGDDPRFPSIEQTFSDAVAPGLVDAPTLRYAEAALGVDTRDQPANTRGGGLYNLSFGAFRDGTRGGFDFNRVDVKLIHVIPIFDKKRGIALHAAASRIDPVGTSRVPFFLMPTVGGADSLRGFREFRFRDTAALTLNAEYRWEAFSGLDLALFVDAANVGPSWRWLVKEPLRTSWGVGFRFNTNKRVFLRVDVASGREGPRIWTAMGPVFRR